jgi:hypothetical protein
LPRLDSSAGFTRGLAPIALVIGNVNRGDQRKKCQITPVASSAAIIHSAMTTLSKSRVPASMVA